MKKRIYLLSIPIYVLFTFIIPVRAQTPLYFNIVSHNESSDPLDYDGKLSDYNKIKPLIKELCDTIISKQAKYNMQVDANFINAVLRWENGSTNDHDLLEWANNSPFIDVDGHNHFIPKAGPGYNPYNFADLAYLLDSCGVMLTKNVLGGVTYADTTVGRFILKENWTQYATPKAGYSFPHFLWQADIVWGTASPGHVADYTKFGIWKPKGGSSPTEFGIHDPNGTITHIGGGCKEDVGFILNGDNKLSHTTQEIIRTLIHTADYIQSIPSSKNDFYTMNMLINFRDIPNIPNFVDSISTIIEGIRPYVQEGKIIWATLAEKYDTWYSTHTDPNDYFKYDCEDIPVSVDEVQNSSLEVQCFPNPTNGIFHIQGEYNNKHNIKVYNILGTCILTDSFTNHKEYDFSRYQKGIYFITVDNINTLKIVIN